MLGAVMLEVGYYGIGCTFTVTVFVAKQIKCSPWENNAPDFCLLSQILLVKYCSFVVM